MTIQEISEGIKKGKHVRIHDYVKPPSSKRTTEEISDVTINCSLEPYDQLLRKAKLEADQYPKIRLSELQRKYKSDLDTSKKALKEVQSSLAKRVNSNSSKSTNKDLIYHTSYFTEDPETGYLYFLGKKVSEQIKKSGSYKKVNSKPKTLIKREITSSLSDSLSRYKIHKSEIENRIELI